MSKIEYDMSPILKVINEAHEKIMNLTVPKKPKMKKREKALIEILAFIETYHVLYVDKFKRDILNKIHEMINENDGI